MTNATQKYTLTFTGATKPRAASSMREALDTARRVLGVDRVYRGSQYVTDEPSGDDRRSVEALDIWTRRGPANSQMDSQADCVITWEGK